MLSVKKTLAPIMADQKEALVMRVPIYLPRFVKLSRYECNCTKKDFDMAYKTAVLIWKMRAGAYVCKDDIICEAEAEKYVYDVLAPVSGYLAEIFVSDGESTDIRTAIGSIETLSE